MTVGETLTASSLGPAAPPSGSATGNGPQNPVNSEPVNADSRQKNPETPLQVNMVTAKIGQELVTSLNLIKDIRRLEKYQRDFFLKVKESLSHVQVLLDHQLMDMAWSDNLIDCEENLLRVSNHLQQQQSNSTVQMSDLYGILLHDREKLNHRFSELSVKSSLSEFVVNSRQLLDINAVRIAAEAILKNEKPIPAQGDHSIPVDHTFFLANFCTASLASSTMASFLPKHYPATTSQVQQQNSAVRYEPKKINGQQQQQPPNQPLIKSRSSGEAVNGMIEVLTPGANSGASGAGTNNSFSSGIYSESDGLDNYLGPMSNGMYGQHELVAAISQITENNPVQPPAQQNKAFNKAKKLWSEGNAPTSGGVQAAGKSESEGKYVRARPTSSGRYQGNEMNIPSNDGAASDSLSSTSEEVGAATTSVTSATATMNTGEIGDNGKPLSFARIASLNLEKQAIHRPPKTASGQSTGSSDSMNPNMMMNAQQNNLAAAAAAAASMASMSMAEAAQAVVVAAQQSMNHHHAHHPMSAMGGYNNPAMAAAAAAMAAQHHMPLVQLPPTNNPRFFFDIAMDGKRLGRAIIEVQASLAPKMAQNFHQLVTSEKGFGYRGCQFFQAWRNESVICGDWEHNSGRGGRAALEDGPLFTPDETKLPCIRGAVGMRRMSKKHSSLNQVASQFRVILANMNTQFTGIFGHVVSGIEALDKVADIGGEGGRPEKIALVTHCGVYKG